jgi:putative oxidoreductase
MILTFLNKYREAGILLLRVAVGLLLIRLGFPVVAGGAGYWHVAAPAVTQFFHITTHLAFWGAVVAFSELIGGLLLLIGLLTRLVCLLIALGLTFQGLAYLGHHPGLNAGTLVVSRMLILYALLLIGPGKYSVDKS